jgi:flagellar basal-body rod modification protein FlgD
MEISTNSFIESLQPKKLDPSSAAKATEKDNSNLGQEDFMKLMTEQLKQQDPFKPMENGDFIAQMAQFNTSNGINELQKSFGDFATSMQSNQALQASSLVGKSVLAPGSAITLDESLDVKGTIDLPHSSPDLRLEIKKSNGEMVKEIYMGTHAKGDINFSWNGQKEDGSVAEPGEYTVSAITHDGEETSQLSTFVYSKVNSVTLGGGKGVFLDVGSNAEISLAEVKRIQ